MSRKKKEKKNKSERVCKLKEWLKHRLVKRVLVGLIISLIIFTFPHLWGPRLAEVIILACFPSGDEYRNSLNIRKIGLTSMVVENVSIEGLPMAPGFDKMTVSYSPWGLVQKKLKSVEVHGFRFKPTHKVDDFSFASLGRAGAVPIPDDPLRGWKVSSVNIFSEGVELGELFPKNIELPIEDTKFNAVLRLHGTDGYYNGIISGTALGASLCGQLHYSQALANGSFDINYSASELIPEAEPLGNLNARFDYSFSGKRGFEVNLNGTVNSPILSRPVAVEGSVTQSLMLFKLSGTALAFDETNGVIRTAFALQPLPEFIKDFALSANLNFTAEVGMKNKIPVWSTDLKVSNANLSLKMNNIPFSVTEGRLSVKAKGMGDLLTIENSTASIREASAATFKFNRGFASLVADKKRLLLTNASIKFCDGNINIYSLYLSFADLRSGFTLELDNVKLGKLIEQVPLLAGSTATGSLYGKVPLRLDKNGMIYLRDAFVYSPPGETGNLSIANPEAIVAPIAQFGIPGVVSENLTVALKNLNYTVLRLDLTSPRSDDGKLRLRLAGEAPVGDVTTPVDLNINIAGPIEKVLNMSIKTAKMVNK